MSKNVLYENFYNVGCAAFKRGQYSDALQAWRKAFKMQKEPALAKKIAQAHFRYALSLDSERSLPQTVSELFQALQYDTSVPVYHYHIGLAYHKQKKYDKAINAYQKALNLAPGNERFLKHLCLAQIELGMEFQPENKGVSIDILGKIHRGKYQEAWDDLQAKKDALKEDEYRLYSAITLTMLKEYEKAKKIWKEMDSCLATYYLGMIYVQEEKWPSALKNLEDACEVSYLKDFCKIPLIWIYQYQASKLASKDEKKAKTLWNKIAALDPSAQGAYNSLAAGIQQGYSYAIEGNYAQAIRTWSRLIRAGNPHPLLLQNCAIAYERKEEYKHSVALWKDLGKVWEKDFSKSLDKENSKKKISVLYNHISQIFNKLDQYDEEKMACKKAAEWNPENVDLQLKTIDFDFQENELTTSISKLKKLLLRFPKNPKVLEFMGECYAIMGNYQRAAECCMDALASIPGEKRLTEILRDLGSRAVNNFLLKRNPLEAKELIKKLIEVDKQYIPHYGLLWKVLFFESKEQEAKAEIEKTLTAFPNNSWVFAEVAKVYFSQNNTKEMEFYLQKAQEISKQGNCDLENKAVIYFLNILKNRQKAIQSIKDLFPEGKEEEKQIFFRSIINQFRDYNKIEIEIDIIQDCGTLSPVFLERGMEIVADLLEKHSFDIIRKLVPILRNLANFYNRYDILHMIMELQMALKMMDGGPGGWNPFGFSRLINLDDDYDGDDDDDDDDDDDRRYWDV
ncbi:MAG: tetratricopeptide repeat protein [Candidatus Brocadiae bacterium]|nr:tetratricopeptide repeat protein [Candidatus Brocadiia bacterium]